MRVISASTSTWGRDTSSFSITAAGAWTYVLDNTNAAVQALVAGAMLSDAFTVTSFDGTASETVTVTITGTNDVPAITGDTTGDVTEDGTLYLNREPVDDVDLLEAGVAALIEGALLAIVVVFLTGGPPGVANVGGPLLRPILWEHLRASRPAIWPEPSASFAV